MENSFINDYISSKCCIPVVNKNTTGERRYFTMPSVGSTMQSFDTSSDKFIKPLDGKGHLVNNDLVHMPKEFVRDTVYTAKALADGVRGKANDHQLGKMNDLGLKLGGLAIAAYLMTKKSTPKTKAMEFIGFGAFLASMALWPKLALEIPARLIHGFNFRKQYIDDQGRKKFVSQDPNYIPFDLYKGDKKSEDLDVIGDRLGIKRDIPNRHEAVKEQMRKISVQNNTLWMLTAGIATPIMTALACNKVEPYVGEYAEKITNRKVNSDLQALDDYLSGRMAPTGDDKKYEQTVLGIGKKDKKGNVIPDAVEEAINNMTGKALPEEQIDFLADAMAKDFAPELKDATKEDIIRLSGGPKYIGSQTSAQRLSKNIHSTILAKDAALAESLNPQLLEQKISNAIVQGAVRDLLGGVAEDVIKPVGDSANDGLVKNFLNAEVGGINFFEVTPETEHMTPAERLAHNIKSVIMKVNNSNPSEDFISGMSEFEGRNKDFKINVIDKKLISGADEIAESFFGGKLAVSEKHEHYIREAVGDAFRGSATRGPKAKKMLSEIGGVITEEVSTHKGFVISEKVGGVLKQAAKSIKKFNAVDRILASSAHFKLEHASETIVANNWQKVTDTMIKHLGYTDKEIELASKNKAKSKEIFMKKMEALASDTKRYNEFLTDIGSAMAELDEKLDAPNAKGNSGVDRLFGGAADRTSGRTMEKIKDGIVKNCDEAGDAFDKLGLSEMKKKMVSVQTDKLGFAGSIKDSRLDRLNSRVSGVHSTFMRLIQTADYFRRAHLYEQEVKNNGAGSVASLGKKYAVTGDHSWNMGLFRKGKDILVDAHTSDFYTKMGLHNKKDNFTTLMWQLFRPDQGGGAGDRFCEETEETMKVLDGVKVSENGVQKPPRRAMETLERVPLGQKLKEHMNYAYDSLGSIVRSVQGNQDPVKVETEVSEKLARACERFDLLGKSPADLMYDALKQKHSSNKWMKKFAPIMAVVTGITVASQFFFGKKDKDIKA